MPNFGITPQGFKAKIYQIILNELHQNQREFIDSDIDLSPEGILGIMDAIWARSDAQIWEALKVCYSQLDPDNAEGVLLDNIAKLSGLARRPATFSLTSVEAIFDAPGVQLLPNVTFFASDSNPEIRFTPRTIHTSLGSGQETVLLRAENSGPILASANDILTISTPVSGLVEVLSSEEINQANSGRVQESDTELRNRRKLSLTLAGSCTLPAIETALREIQDDSNAIYYVKVFEALNMPTDFVELRNSFKAIIYDSGSSTEWNNKIAQTIWDNKPAGIQPLGSDTGEVTVQGEQVEVRFERAEVIDLYVSGTWYYTGSEPNLAQVRSYMKNIIDSGFDVGDDIVSFRVAAIPLGIPNGNIKDVDFNTFAIGTSPGPTSNDNIVISFNEKPVIDTANIQMTFLPFIDQN